MNKKGIAGLTAIGDSAEDSPEQERDLKGEVVEAVADALGCKVDDLFDRD